MKEWLKLASRLWEKPAYGICVIFLLGLGYLLSSGGEVRLSLVFSPDREQPKNRQALVNMDSRSGNAEFDYGAMDSRDQK